MHDEIELTELFFFVHGRNPNELWCQEPFNNQGPHISCRLKGIYIAFRKCVRCLIFKRVARQLKTVWERQWSVWSVFWRELQGGLRRKEKFRDGGDSIGWTSAELISLFLPLLVLFQLLYFSLLISHTPSPHVMTKRVWQAHYERLASFFRIQVM